MSTVKLEGISKNFGTGFAVEDFNLTVASGEAVVLLGPSGCGKTTTLRMVAGFEAPTSGRITIGDREVVGSNANVPPESRGVGMVFQSYALWPHLKVDENVGFGLTTSGARRRQRRTHREVANAVERALEQVQLSGYGDRYPHELSGGQQQRVALARALVTNPSVLLLDEPLSNLDTRLREEMRFEIRRLQRESGITMIYITHDRSEALGLADRIVCLRKGRIQQIGPPEDLYRQPATRFVAGTLGPANVLELKVVSLGENELTARLPTGGAVTLSTNGLLDVSPGETLPACIRPADLFLDFEAPVPNARIENRSFLGDETHYIVDVQGVDEPVRVIDRRATNYPRGTTARLEVDPGRISILHGELGVVRTPEFV